MANLTSEQQQALANWYVAKQKAEEAAAKLASSELAKAAAVTAQQAALLETVAREACFPTIEEGTRKIELSDGWQLKTACTFKRDIDVRVLESLRAPLEAQRASLDALVRWKASLETKAYRELTAEARAIFDTCLTTKPGVPTLELVAPKVKL